MHLTRRETAVLARIALGWNDRAIAESKNVQLATARKHRERFNGANLSHPIISQSWGT